MVKYKDQNYVVNLPDIEFWRAEPVNKPHTALVIAYRYFPGTRAFQKNARYEIYVRMSRAGLPVNPWMVFHHASNGQRQHMHNANSRDAAFQWCQVHLLKHMLAEQKHEEEKRAEEAARIAKARAEEEKNKTPEQREMEKAEKAKREAELAKREADEQQARRNAILDRVGKLGWLSDGPDMVKSSNGRFRIMDRTPNGFRVRRRRSDWRLQELPRRQERLLGSARQGGRREGPNWQVAEQRRRRSKSAGHVERTPLGAPLIRCSPESCLSPVPIVQRSYKTIRRSPDRSCPAPNARGSSRCRCNPFRLPRRSSPTGCMLATRRSHPASRCHF